MSEVINMETLLQLLPHRYPFLLIDRITEYISGKQAQAIKNVSINEPFFQGHFPQNPIMPGVLIIEAMAQLGGILLMHGQSIDKKLALLAGVDKIRFRRMVIPGDQLHLRAEILKIHGNVGKIKTTATLDNALVCEGELLFSLTDI